MNNPKHLYAQVAPAIPLKNEGAQAFTYAVAPDMEEELTLFSRVVVPFGKRLLPGIVLGLSRRKPPYPTKSLRLLPGDGLTAYQVAFARWIADTMHGGLGYTLRLFTPPPGPLPISKKTRGRALPGNISAVAAKVIQLLPTKSVLYVEAHSAARAETLRGVIKHYWKQRQQVLIVVPEKWMIETLLGSLPASPAIVEVHGALSTAAQKKIWTEVKAGKIRVVIGTQKALFLPFHALGVIILEEEGHPSHKLWDQYPRLSNWYAVQQLQHIYQCHVLCTAAFPSLKAWAAVEQKDMVQVGTRPLAPKIRLMASTFADRDSHFLLPQEFLQQLKRWSAGGKNIFLLHARPGSWQTAVCRACHKAQRCPTCNLALAVRGSGSKTRLHCAQCQEDSPLPAVCAVCKKGKLRFFGPGSETLSGIVSKILPRQKIASLDAQALKSLSPAALQKLLRSHPIILGTSALLRYDLPQTFDQLVWLFPEASLLYPDVRTHERHLFELARLQGLQPGRAITVVTRQAELVREQLDTPIATLYPRLLRERKRLHYPPVNDMVRLTLKGTTAHQAMKKGVALRQLLDARLQALGDGARDIRIRGPFQSFQTRSRREHEVHILLLGNIERLTALHRGLPADVVDLDPQRII